MTTKNAKKNNTKSNVVNLPTVKTPSLKDLIAGKGEAVAHAVAKKMGESESEPKTDTKNPTITHKKAAMKQQAPKLARAKELLANTKKESGRKETVASFMRRLITDGKSNEEVFAAAKKEFGIGDDKKSYPSWYRSEMQRKKNAARDEAKKTTAKKPSKKS